MRQGTQGSSKLRYPEAPPRLQCCFSSKLLARLKVDVTRRGPETVWGGRRTPPARACPVDMTVSSSSRSTLAGLTSVSVTAETKVGPWDPGDGLSAVLLPLSVVRAFDCGVCCRVHHASVTFSLARASKTRTVAETLPLPGNSC